MRLLPKRKRFERTQAMTVVEHLEELRYRIIVALVAIAAGMIPAWFLYPSVLKLLLRPFCTYVHGLPAANRPPAGCRLIVQGVVDPFLVKMKVVVFLGFGLALPVVLYQFWEFVTPGLTDRERRLVLPFIASSIVFFVGGAALAYLTLTNGLNFLLGIGGSSLTPLLTAPKYLSFVLFMALAFGISFEFPLILVTLALVRILPSSKLRRWRRPAILIIFVYAAVITPSQDPFTLFAMAIPMYLFYEAAILVARLAKR